MNGVSRTTWPSLRTPTLGLACVGAVVLSLFIARLALGTDFHSHLEFDGTWAVVRELEMYEEAGVDPPTLLGLASRNGAAWLGLQDELGLVEEGFLADLLVLAKNPLSEGASVFREMLHIVAAGQIFETRAPEPPVHA